MARYRTSYQNSYQTRYQTLYRTSYRTFYQTSYRTRYQTLYRTFYQTLYQTSYQNFFMTLFMASYRTPYMLQIMRRSGAFEGFSLATSIPSVAVYSSHSFFSSISMLCVYRSFFFRSLTSIHRVRWQGRHVIIWVHSFTNQHWRRTKCASRKDASLPNFRLGYGVWRAHVTNSAAASIPTNNSRTCPQCQLLHTC